MDIQFKYFLKNFQLFYNIRDGEIGYSQNQGTSVIIERKIDDSFWSKEKDIDCNKVAWKNWKGVRIPFLFNHDSTKDIVVYDRGRATINYDIVASTFYFLSGWNELVNPHKDHLGRPIFEKSSINKLTINDVPVVNYYFDILYEAIREVSKKNVKKNIWDDRKYAVALTHDIDTCRSAWLEGSYSEIKKKNFSSVPGLIAARFLKGKDAWFNFDEISRIEKQYDASSSFFFLPQSNKTGSLKNADYKIESNEIRNVIYSLKKEGHDIGVHGSPGTHKNARKLKTEIEKTGAGDIKGNRFHYLLFDSFKSVSVLEECGIKYDTSLGFPEQTGFRRATCFPFYLFNFEKDDISPVIEIPLTVMDLSLAYKKYMGLTQQESLGRIFKLIGEVKKHGGVFTILWHNNFFSDYKYAGWREVYIKILDYCKSTNALLTNARIIYEKICGET
ncbi:MAG: polysaccharide deacetylase family protein [Bacteroidales bacterium]